MSKDVSLVRMALVLLVLFLGCAIHRSDPGADPGGEIATIRLAMVVGAEDGVGLDDAKRWVGCRSCRLETRAAPSRDRTFVVADAAFAEIRSSDVARVLVREELRLEDSASSYFSVAIERAEGASETLQSLHEQTPLWLAFEIDGQIVGIQSVGVRGDARVRVGWAETRTEAVELGARFGSVVALASSQEELAARRERALDFLAEAFRANQCAPDSEAARAQQAGYEIMLRRVPALADRVECEPPQ